ncbi:MAG: hypothetical protein CL424_16165 [Acidimicrobiaceae bacterium]|nr:hypothetical protein [Acidimicrobiaceae bacterium]
MLAGSNGPGGIALDDFELVRSLGVVALVHPTPHIADVVRRGAAGKDPVEMTITGTSIAIGRQIVELGLPDGVLIVALTRDDDLIVPQGGTVLEPGDQLLVLADPSAVADTCQALGAERTSDSP